MSLVEQLALFACCMFAHNTPPTRYPSLAEVIALVQKGKFLKSKSGYNCLNNYIKVTVTLLLHSVVRTRNYGPVIMIRSAVTVTVVRSGPVIQAESPVGRLGFFGSLTYAEA